MEVSQFWYKMGQLESYPQARRKTWANFSRCISWPTTYPQENRYKIGHFGTHRYRTGTAEIVVLQGIWLICTNVPIFLTSYSYSKRWSEGRPCDVVYPAELSQTGTLVQPRMTTFQSALHLSSFVIPAACAAFFAARTFPAVTMLRSFKAQSRQALLIGI